MSAILCTMQTMTGYGATMELTDEALTIRRRKSERVLPLAAIQSIEFAPAKGLTPGHVRAVLVADWTPPKKPALDMNTVTYIDTKLNDGWQAFALEIQAGVDTAIPKLSLPEFSHHAGSGWADSANIEIPAALASPQPARSLSSRIHDWAATESRRFEGLSLSGGVLSYDGKSQNVAGMRVSVETVGGIGRRGTVTRAAAGGLLFGKAGAVAGALVQKRVDEREMYLHVEGVTYTWSVEVKPSKGAAARAFAARVNTAAKAAARNS